MRHPALTHVMGQHTSLISSATSLDYGCAPWLWRFMFDILRFNFSLRCGRWPLLIFENPFSKFECKSTHLLHRQKSANNTISKFRHDDRCYYRNSVREESSLWNNHHYNQSIKKLSNRTSWPTNPIIYLLWPICQSIHLCSIRGNRP